MHNKTSMVPSKPSQQTVVHKWIHTKLEVTWFNASAAQTHTHTQTQTHTYIPVTSFLLIASPNASIFGLPLTAVIMSQTVINASRVHFLPKRKCNSWFCILGCLVLVMSLLSPSSMMLLCKRSPTIASASTSLMNRCQNWSSTSLAEWRGQNQCYTNQPILPFTVGSLYHCPSTKCVGIPPSTWRLPQNEHPLHFGRITTANTSCSPPPLPLTYWLMGITIWLGGYHRMNTQCTRILREWGFSLQLPVMMSLVINPHWLCSHVRSSLAG